MANIRTCNKHNMIACVEKTEHNADFHQIVDYLTGCSINYSLLVDPDLIGPWLQQFWATASLRSINEVPHIRAMVAGKRVLISEETIRADLLFDDADGVDCFPKQVIWDSLRDIGYEGNLAQLTFSKPLFSPQWKYLVHVLLHCLSPKSTSWEQFGTNIASALFCKLMHKVTCSISSQRHKKRSKKHKKHKKKVSSVKLGRNKEEGTLSEEHYGQEDFTTEPFFDDFVDKDAADLERKSDETEEIIYEEKKLLSKEFEIQRTVDLDDNSKYLLDITKRFDAFMGSIQTQPQQPSQDLETNKEVGRLQGKFKLEWDQEERKRLKSQGYKNLQKLKYPQMKELYDKVRESIKDSYKDFIPMGSEKERLWLQERNAKRLSRKRKLSISVRTSILEAQVADKETIMN
ncbi:hypothetical protein Tco_0145750 [Tanacetum coccineum]